MTPPKPARPGRRPLASHARLASPHPLAFVAKLAATMLGVLTVTAMSVGSFTVWDTATALVDQAVVLDPGEELPPSLGAIEGGVNVLLAGTDACEGQDLKLFPRCANGDSPGERNDVTMLVHISDEPRRVTVVSFPRDMVVPIPSCADGQGGYYSAMSAQKMNASYFYGGLTCTVATVEQLIGDDIDFAAAIRWTGVINMSDAIGGVDVCVAGEIDDGHTGLHLKAGTHTLKGAKALQFLRIRHGIGDGSDLGRISNQQQFMSSMVRKLQSDAVLADPGRLLTLATTAVNQVQQKQLLLSSGLTNPTLMVQIAMAVKDVPYEDIVFVQYPTEYVATGSSGETLVMPVTYAADELFAALKKNKPIALTGAASQGYGVEVTGEAKKPKPTATPVPTSDAPVSPSATPTPVKKPKSEKRVDLPSEIAGQTAAQTTCTVPQG